MITTLFSLDGLDKIQDGGFSEWPTLNFDNFGQLVYKSYIDNYLVLHKTYDYISSLLGLELKKITSNMIVHLKFLSV